MFAERLLLSSVASFTSPKNRPFALFSVLLLLLGLHIRAKPYARCRLNAFNYLTISLLVCMAALDMAASIYKLELPGRQQSLVYPIAVSSAVLKLLPLGVALCCMAVAVVMLKVHRHATPKRVELVETQSNGLTPVTSHEWEPPHLRSDVETADSDTIIMC